ncbi:membrane protein insertase YidC [Thioclava sp. BHET1]|nr:membrane protein insertase YidC [Thioclava sp. BHET1]
MGDQNKNLILATALSFLVILVWFLVFPPKDQPKPAQPQATASQSESASPAAPATGSAASTGAGSSGAAAAKTASADLPRIQIKTPRLQGSISVQGGRIDDLLLTDYPETLAKNSPPVRLLSPVGKPHAYYALYGWAPGGDLSYADVPGANTVWTISSGKVLTPTSPVTLTWDNGKGLIFTRKLSIDDNYMFTVTQSVENKSGQPVTLAPYGMVVRQGKPAESHSSYILHEGIVQMDDSELTELGYDKLKKLDAVEAEGGPAEIKSSKTNGWIGFTDKYWMTSLIPTQGKPFTEVAKYTAQSDIYQTETRLPVVTVAAGQESTTSTRLFAGAKEYDTLRMYQNKEHVTRFIDSIDWGWFFFITKPIYWLMHNLHALLGNMGLAIICLTLIIKAILFPLAYKSYVSMARMKELQPEIEALKERAGEDKQKLQKEMMQLYKEKKVNPAAGCLPMLLQIPIFFSLYKVIYVTIELRQAPFYGWIRDLSAPDPSTWLNLFGLLPWAGPGVTSIIAPLSLGVLPLLLGVTMWMQQKLNPAPTDPTQKMIFAWMPLVFMFMLGHFASGLVLYYITNNSLTFLQQYTIMRRHGHSPDVFGNIRASFKRKPKTPAEKPKK